MWFRVSKSRARIAKYLFVPYTFLNDWSWPIEACRVGLQSLKCVASRECMKISDEELLEET